MIEKIINFFFSELWKENILIMISSSLWWVTSYLYWLYKGNSASVKMFFLNLYIGWFIWTLSSYFSKSIFFCTIVWLFSIKILEILEKNLPLIIEKKLKEQNLIDK